ncbi:MAG TPA: hypothetical protein PKC91_02095 [Ignavibacteria bacterium]|nr:hypothetical protein [Ignavibacteria bacterium]
MAKINFVVISFLFLFVNVSVSQSSKWENFTDLKNISSLATDTSSGKIYCASNGGLYTVEASTGAVLSKYTNLNGLINNDITSLSLDNSKKLWIGASDGSISILNLQNLTWKYIFDIKNSTESNKSINYLFQAGSYMFVATGYGIQKISDVDYSFVDAPYYKLGSFPNNTAVYALTTNNNILYAATKTGVAYANYVNSNLNNPATWSNYNGLSLNAEVKTIETYNNMIFAGSLSGFSYFDGTTWLPYPNASVSNQNTVFIKTMGSNLYFISGNFVFYSNISNLANIIQFQSSNSYKTLSYDSQRQPVLGLTNNGITMSSSGYLKYIFPNSPFSNSFNQIVIDNDNNVWAAGGTVNSGFYKFNGSSWENYNLSSHPGIGNSNWFQKVSYGNGNVWALGFGGGPSLILADTVLNYNPSNSILPGISNDPNFCSSYGGAYDNFGVFWVTFFATNSGGSLYALSTGNDWIRFINPSIISTSSLSEIAVDSYNTKWIVSSGSRSGIYYFNENGSLSNPADDIYGFYDNSDFGSEVTNITDIIVDKNNEVWITTNNGVFIINNPYAAIQNPNLKPRPQKLGIISGNLKVPFTENCISITYDILNSKWIGTETNGVFHLSPDGSTLIEQLNTVNTPILSNKVTTIAVSNETGKAFFGTQKGMSSYSTDAIEPVSEFDKINASPNPYLLPSAVNLKIDGLVENSVIKILTLNGEVVTEFDSPGGRIAFWNGRNQNNELAATGIYIIVAFNNDGSKVGTGKVAIVNK